MSKNLNVQPIRKPLTGNWANCAPAKCCPKCGKKMDGTYQTDAATHDGWLTIHRIEFWLYHCSECEELEEIVIDYHCKICEAEARKLNENAKEIVQFT